VEGALPPGVKRPGREANHSLPPRGEVKNAQNYISKPPYVSKALYLVKYRDNFTFETLTRNHYEFRVAR
jgi:hypothetical protein